ncbi:hypothetical protein CDD80_2134 [Ophiocordyceps camponoti-rufipedis]|uniref:Uncharacterized protein n=1 Tax=Ophiocordyceps camponoti-rufipedis TaxID=2004952 RepID=A0A2C5ZKB8_9HYPO|nr:hypothetical protein CDD80_2134 [Ophiocordyceps camponoti-rufipedis]
MWPAASFLSLLWLQWAFNTCTVYGESLSLNQENNSTSAQVELKRRDSEEDDELTDVTINSDLTAVRDILRDAELGKDLWDLLSKIADEIAAKDLLNIAKTLEIDPVKSKLKEPTEKMGRLLDDSLKRTKQQIGIQHIRRLQFRSQVSSRFKSGMKSSMLNPFELIGAGLDIHKAFKEDNTVLNREAALTSLIPVVGCGPEAQIARERGELNHWDFIACVVGGVLVFTPLQPFGLAILTIRKVISEATPFTETKRMDFHNLWNETNIQKQASDAWDKYCERAWSEGILSDEFSNASLDFTKAEAFALQYAATKELSVLNLGYQLLILGSSSSDEHAAIQLSYRRARTKSFIDLCDVTEARRDDLDVDKHKMVMKWLREQIPKFKEDFKEEYRAEGSIVIRILLAKQLHNAMENSVTRRREKYEGYVNQTVDGTMGAFEPQMPGWEKRKTQLPQSFINFCEKKRSLRKELAGGPAANEVDCRSSDFWTNKEGKYRLTKLYYGDLRCKLDDKSYGLNNLFFTACPVGASKTSLACDSKPISVLDPEDYELLSRSGIDEGLVHGGPSGVSGWKAPEVWSEITEKPKQRTGSKQEPQSWIQAKPLETMNCKAKNISWDFFDIDTVAVAEGKVKCGLPGRPWQSMRWINGPTPLVEICETTQACKLYEPGRNLTSDFPKRAAAYGLPAERPPPPWDSRLLDCSALHIDWKNIQSEGWWMLDPVRRVAEGWDRCGSKEHGTNYWFQWSPRWSDVQYSQGRNYSSLVEMINGEDGDRLDFNGSALYFPTEVKASTVAHMTTPPPENQNISGKPWHGKRPGTSIICNDMNWLVSDSEEVSGSEKVLDWYEVPDSKKDSGPKEVLDWFEDPDTEEVWGEEEILRWKEFLGSEDALDPEGPIAHVRQTLIAKGYVSCGRHGLTETWHWAEKGKKLVRCRSKFPGDSEITCVAWDVFDNLSVEAMVSTRETKIPIKLPPLKFMRPHTLDANPRFFIDADAFEVATPEATHGCAKVSKLTYTFEAGDSNGDGTHDMLYYRLGSSSFYRSLISGFDPGKSFTRNITKEDFTKIFKSSALDQHKNLYLNKLDFLEIRDVGVKSLFDGWWRLKC